MLEGEAHSQRKRPSARRAMEGLKEREWGQSQRFLMSASTDTNVRESRRRSASRE